MGAVQPLPIASTDETTPTQAERTPRVLLIWTALGVIGVVVSLYMGLVYAGTDVDQGEVQRLFYFHVPAFSGAFIAFIATVIGGIQYLRTRQAKWDTLALAGVEVGLAMSLVNVSLGSVWARPIWNTWWTWDPRLTSSAISILTYAAYLMLRNGIENPEQRRRFAAVYGILAFSTVIIVLVITRIRPDTIHPVVVGTSPQNSVGGFSMADRQKIAIGINSLIYSVLVPIPLLWHRIRLENLSERVNAVKAKLMEQ